MANDSICVFCGERAGAFRGTTVRCGGTWQVACKTCEKEMKNLDDVEVCRRALVRGIAEHPDKLREYIDFIAEVEDHRLKCLRCGGKLTFMDTQELDNTPLRDTVFDSSFDILPAYCSSCGKYEFYNPAFIRKDKYLLHLFHKDTTV